MGGLKRRMELYPHAPEDMATPAASLPIHPSSYWNENAIKTYDYYIYSFISTDYSPFFLGNPSAFSSVHGS